jgi:glycerol-3-phosphate acyltransferase PlsY
MSSLLVWRHRGNIAKLMRGQESRIGDKKKTDAAAKSAAGSDV